MAAQRKMQLVDWLDDLCVRFIINLPQEELGDVARICFQIEEAQWFYEDFVRPIDPTLPSLNLKSFCLKIFQHCPLLSGFTDDQHLAAYQDFLGYKTRVPVRGAIMLNEEMDKVVLVKGWKSSASWSFPRGKINKDEKDLDCAVREVYEETGYDISEAGLVPDPETVKAIDVTMREQHMRLFVFRGVPEDTPFEPKTRKEISKIQWFKLNDLPTLKKSHTKQGAQEGVQEGYNPSKFYMVAPFLGPLRKWIHQQRKMDAQQAMYEEYPEGEETEAYVEEQQSQLPEISVPPSQMVNPAAELKKLLSVQSTQQGMNPLQSMPSPVNQQKATSLLAMIRGEGPVNAHAGASAFPQTPLEQMGGWPQQQPPQSPHAQHVRESPFATSRPPPQFSPHHDQTHPAQPAQHYGQMALHPALNTSQQNLLSIMQQQSQRSAPQLHHHSQPSFQQHTQQVPSQPSHHSTSPAAIHLPPPPLNNHAMGLLNAFRAGPNTGRTNPALLDTLRSNPPPRNSQQNTLLDLLKGPGSTPTPTAMGDGVVHEIASSQPPPMPSKTGEQPPKTTRRPSAMSMITRTLPKVRLEEKKPVVPAPTMDDSNFPTLTNAAAPKQRHSRGGSAGVENGNVATVQQPVKILARPESSHAPEAVVAPQTSRPVSRGKPTPTLTQPVVTILQRPTSNPRSSSSSRRTPKPAQSQEGLPKPPFQPRILKRGGESELDISPPTTGALSSQRPSLPSEDLPSPTQNQSQSHNQRNALLSLFAQQSSSAAPANDFSAARGLMSPPLVSPTSESINKLPFATRPPLTGMHSGSSNGGSHPFNQAQLEPSRHPSQGSIHGIIGERSRVGSRVGSYAAPTQQRQGSLGDGPMSPGTPVEARGFLMDYLDGVIRGPK